MEKRILEARPRAGREAAQIAARAAVAVILCAALVASPGRCRAGSEETMPPVRPGYNWVFDGATLAVGATLLAIGNPLQVTRQYVPPEGLDPATIHWSLDRHSIHELNEAADRDSDIFRDLAVAYPMVLAFITESSGRRWSGTLWRTIEYVQVISFSEGISAITKNSADRPRPYTYRPASELPDNPAYNVNSDEAFRSMPSGHATMSFCAAGFATADHLISRPDAGWLEVAGVGFIGGLLAGMTSGMRIEGGQHFPSDDIVGGLIGSACGFAVPMLHRCIGSGGYCAPRPPAHAWWQAAAGEALGVVAGFGLSTIY